MFFLTIWISLCVLILQSFWIVSLVVTDLWDIKLCSFDFHILGFIYLELIFVCG